MAKRQNGNGHVAEPASAGATAKTNESAASAKRPRRGAAVADWPTQSGRRPVHVGEGAAAAAVPVNWPSTGAADSLVRRHGLDENGLAVRRAFVRLGEEDRALLLELHGWAQEVAPEIAREFYDWQFSFPATRQFFEHIANGKGMPLGALRSLLEAAQAGYLTEVFAGAAVNWDLRYFEKRLQIAATHDRIDLPFKWYVGSYPEYNLVIARYLRRDFADEEQVRKIETAVGRVFNLDLQAIGDAFILNTVEGMLESAGIRIEDVCSSGERSEQIGKLQRALHAQLASFTAGIQEISGQHEKGEIDARMEPEKFLGAFKTMAQGVDDMVSGHVAVQRRAMVCLAEFAKGNFEASMDRLPGKRAFINDTIESVRANLNGFIAEMTSMAEEHDKGDIDVVIPVEKFHGAYRVMAQGVNNMVGSHIAAKKKALACVAEFGKGNFEAPLERFPGQRAFINDIIEQVRTNLKNLIGDLHLLSAAAVDGKLTTRADGSRHQGDFRKIVEGINATLNAVIEPINEAGAVLSKIADQDLTAAVTGDYRGDHAAIKNNINRMTADLRESLRQVKQSAASLSSSAGELIGVSQQMAGNAEETATQANVVSAASEQVTQNINTVSSATEQMQTSIREIAKNSNEAARVAKHAVDVAQSTNRTITKLGASSAEIGNVIKVITSIAQQTNLLALNATIEAARAGEAGKGFAVVANEVKELAKQTAKATEEISKKIEAIQGDTGGAVKAIDEIGAIINQINDITNSIASAVEEQTVTTNEISRSVGEAASGSAEISKNISGVAMAAQGTTRGAVDSQQSAEALNQMAEQLQAVVGRFKV